MFSAFDIFLSMIDWELPSSLGYFFNPCSAVSSGAFSLAHFHSYLILTNHNTSVTSFYVLVTVLGKTWNYSCAGLRHCE